MTTTVVHCQKEKYDVYIGRPSEWGNPYTHTESQVADFKVEDREEAIEKYKVYLVKRIKEETGFREKLLELDGKVLGCWCAPKYCHGDVISMAINEIKLGLL
jgi:hypothetical protein